jgi:tRNA A-37 threonylcarbamoyl transferase component Bud32
LPAVPGYKVECELGRGAVGVVYKARDTRLNRFVALKMVLAGPFAAPATRARFLLEAESVAAVQHPHVVQVFASGEHAGHPFLAMEYLSGGTLADRVNRAGPLPPTGAAELVLKLAGGVAAAHQKGVVHRDLKPGNVLLTAAGEPKLTDFGLAKVDRSDITASGAVLGTPSYMAPEQAAGKAREVGTPADVYGIGAILYNLLTGRPPFEGESAAATVQLVLASDPVRPRSLAPGVPRDLETICLKCLEKDPARRYPTAAALADDLRSFLAGRPVAARPAGAAGRAWKWARRNKAVAGAAATTTLALVAGAGAAVGFGLEASRQADAARANAKAAEEERASAVSARNDLLRANDDLLGSAARGLLAPIGLHRDDGPGGQEPLTSHEVDALWEVATRRGGPLGRRFVSEGAVAPKTAAQLRKRAGWCLHAVVGLDPGERGEVEAILRAGLEAPGHPVAHRLELALVVNFLGDIDSATASAASRALTDGLGRITDPGLQRELARALAAAAGRMEPRDGAAALSGAMDRASDPFVVEELARGLSEVAGRMDPGSAAAVCGHGARTLHRVLLASGNPFAPLPVARGLSAVAGRMRPADAANVFNEAAGTLIGKLRGTIDPAALDRLAEALAVVTGRMEPTAAAGTLTRALDPDTRPGRPAADSPAAGRLAAALVAAAGRMDPRDAADTLAAVMDRTTDSFALAVLAAGLARVPDRISHEVEGGKGSGEIRPPLRAPPGFPGKLPAPVGPGAPEAGTLNGRGSPHYRAAIALLGAMKTADPFAARRLAAGLAGVTAGVSPEDAADLLFRALDLSAEPAAVGELAQGITAAARRRGGAGATRILTRAMDAVPNPAVVSYLAEGLVDTAARADGGDADSARRLAIDTLTRAIAGTADPAALEQLATALATVTGHGDPKDAGALCRKAADDLAGAMAAATDLDAQGPLARGLAALAVRLEPTDAAAIGRRAANALLRSMSSTTDTYTIESLAGGLAAVATLMNPVDAEVSLTLGMARVTDPIALSVLAGGLVGVAGRMDPGEAAAVLTRARTGPAARGLLAMGLVATAGRMAPENAAAVSRQAADTLIGLMADATVWGNRREWALGLVTAAGRLTPGEAVSYRYRAATALLEAAAVTTYAGDLEAVAGSLATVLLPHDTRDLAGRVRSITLAVGGAGGPGQLLALTAHLRPVVAPLPDPLPPQALVDLLKHPLCVGGARRVVLDALRVHYRRPFADQWEFARFARENRIPLDLTSPPVRAAAGPVP